MHDADSTESLLRRVRQGDEQAARELVGRYEGVIRRQVRVWLRLQDSRLRGIFDSMDICQSVLASFFVRAANGQFDLDDPGKLAGLLVRIARHKLLYQVTRHHADRRDVRRRQHQDSDLEGESEVLSPDPGPSRVASGRELLEEFRSRLSVDERLIAERRVMGYDWSAIAADLGGTAEGRRKQFARALDRVSRELGIDGDVLET